MNSQEIKPLTSDLFDEWYKSAKIESHEEGIFLILTDYENSIEVNINGMDGWKIDSPITLGKENEEKIFSKVEEYITPEKNNFEHPSIAGGIYCKYY